MYLNRCRHHSLINLCSPHYFKNVRMSALALLKIVMHATKGQPLEVMGLMQGKIEGDTFIVLDSFALPVEGTETRVNAGAEAIEYMAQYVGLSERCGRNENVVGWYHSHPGYGCWLSGIDVNTQVTNQKFQDPFIAVVIDPVRTVSAGKVDLGAFRTYPEGYKPPVSQSLDYQSIPMDKIEDFGVYHDQYYQMDVEFFKSSSDTALLNLLWNKYWINILSSSPLVKNRFYTNSQISDLSKKIDRAETEIGRGSNRFGYSHSAMLENSGKKEKDKETELSKITKDSTKLTVEVLTGLVTQVTKDSLFNAVEL
jgi:COP9 signalosome complex subunit 5